jgi:hypothetical protein
LSLGLHALHTFYFLSLSFKIEYVELCLLELGEFTFVSAERGNNRFVQIEGEKLTFISSRLTTRRKSFPITDPLRNGRKRGKSSIRIMKFRDFRSEDNDNSRRT